MIDSFYFLQFACFIFMLINALILGITHLHMKSTNRRYEWSRWLILAGMTGLAIQYLLQMLLGFRAKSDDLGAIFNILVYTPCITTISMGIYNIEATPCQPPKDEHRLRLHLCRYHSSFLHRLQQ